MGVARCPITCGLSGRQHSCGEGGAGLGAVWVTGLGGRRGQVGKSLGLAVDGGDGTGKGLGPLPSAGEFPSP